MIRDISEAYDILFYELQNGFYVKAPGGVNIYSFLSDYCGIADSYIKEKIKTIFHNGNPVDHPEGVKLSEGSVCAISGAMPGLVGAMMRMESPYAAMRMSITEHGGTVSSSTGEIYVRLKLFNVILSDIGGNFVSSGAVFDLDDTIRIIKKIEISHGSPFSFTVDDIYLSSSDTGRLTDKKYRIKAV